MNICPDMPARPLLSVVVPCYNEEAVLQDTAASLSQAINELVESGSIHKSSAIYFIDDGSRDKTWDIIASLNHDNPGRYHGIRLSRNGGHQNALLAGLRNVPGDIAISIDADLQDDINVFGKMISMYSEGYEIVYGTRADRKVDTFFKRSTAKFYYKILGSLGVDIVPNHADFRLMGRRSLNALNHYKEVNVFLRAIIPLIGYKTGQVFYDRKKRMAGESKYPLTKMIALAINGVTSFSMKPLRWITAAGFLIASLSFFVGVWAIGVAFFSDVAAPGWASIIIPNSFLGGLQLLSIGIIGEYIGRIYLEVKRRPPFEIAETI